MADLIVDNVTKEFPAAEDKALVVLKGASFELSRGENMAIVGDSGSGKSTLLHIIGALDRPTSGSVSLAGQDPFDLPEKQLAAFRNENIGFVFQDHHLLPQLTILENVLLPALADGRTVTDEDVERGHYLLKQVGLSERESHRPATISGGERGRAAVARALIMQPQLLLADEPTGNLDHENAQMISNLLVRLQEEENAMLIVVTHSRELAGQLQQQRRLNSGVLE